MKLIDKLLSFAKEEEWIKDLNDFGYEYSWICIKYLSITRSHALNEFNDVFFIKFLSDSFLKLDSFDEEVLFQSSKEEWIEEINSIIFNFSIFTLKVEDDSLCVNPIERLQMLNEILISFKQLD